MKRGIVDRFARLWAYSLAFTAACAGHALDLDRTRDGQAGAGAGGRPSAAEVRVKYSINDFWVDDERIYWRAIDENFSELQSCVYEDCKATTVSYGKPTSPQLTLAEKSVFFVGESNIGASSGPALLTCPKQGCLGTPQQFVKLQPTLVLWSAADANYLYWSSTFDIYRCPLTGCAEVPETVAQGYTSWGKMILADSQLYWWNNDSHDLFPSGYPASLYRSPVDGSEAPTLVSPPRPTQSGPLELAIGGNRVYWIEGGTRIMSCPVAGCGTEPAAVLLDSAQSKSGLLVDDRGIYWGDSIPNSAEVTPRFCPLTGCPEEGPRTLAPKVGKFRINSRHLYWTVPMQEGEAYGIEKVIYRDLKPMIAD